jgi:CIC family chloride channel protein
LDFTLEIFSLDLTLGALVPLLLASATGSITGLLLSDEATLFTVSGIQSFDPGNLPADLGVGLLMAVLSVYIKRIYRWGAQQMESIKRPWFRSTSGGLMLGAAIFMVPPLYGEGFGIIQSALKGDIHALLDQSFIPWQESSAWMIIVLIFGLGILKAIAAGLTIHAGGVGGMFAPTLFMGSVFGLAYVLVLNQFGLELPTVHFVLVSMSALMAGVMHAPLTAVFMISEISGGYPLILPLMIVSAISFFLSRAMEQHSIYTASLAADGGLWTSNKDQAALGLLEWNQILDMSVPSVSPSTSLADAEKLLYEGRKNLLAVVEEGRIIGTLGWEDLRRARRMENQPDKIRDVMSGIVLILNSEMTIEECVQKIEGSDLWLIPVNEKDKFKGFMSKAKLFDAYRRQLRDLSQEL